MISLYVSGSLDFIRGCFGPLFKPTLHDLSVFSGPWSRPPIETVCALDTKDHAAEMQILLFEREIFGRARWASKLRVN